MNELTLSPHKEYKVFLVEVDDDERERVIVGRTAAIAFDYKPQYDTVHVDDMLSSARIFKTGADVEVTLRMLPIDDKGTFFRMENFNQEENEEDE